MKGETTEKGPDILRSWSIISTPTTLFCLPKETNHLINLHWDKQLVRAHFEPRFWKFAMELSLIHISEPTRRA